MKELMGGLSLAGLIAWSILGFIPGILLLLAGAGAGVAGLIKESYNNKQAESWRAAYPTYKY